MLRDKVLRRILPIIIAGTTTEIVIALIVLLHWPVVFISRVFLFYLAFVFFYILREFLADA